MTGFEPRTSGIGSNRSTNCATTTAQVFARSYVSKLYMVGAIGVGLSYKVHKMSANKFVVNTLN